MFDQYLVYTENVEKRVFNAKTFVWNCSLTYLDSRSAPHQRRLLQQYQDFLSHPVKHLIRLTRMSVNDSSIVEKKLGCLVLLMPFTWTRWSLAVSSVFMSESIFLVTSSSTSFKESIFLVTSSSHSYTSLVPCCNDIRSDNTSSCLWQYTNKTAR